MIKLQYWWTDSLGGDNYHQRSLIVEADTIEECHVKFEKETGRSVYHCHIEKVE